MGISRFILILLLISVAVVFYEKEQVGVMIDDEEKPSISFYDSVVYQISQNGIDQVIQAKESYVYKTREELIEATIISKNSQKLGDTSLVSGDYIVKVDDRVYIDGNVRLNLPNSIDIHTEQLEYNLKTKIARNNVKFDMTQSGNIFEGRNLYVNLIDKKIKADKTKMRIKFDDTYTE